MTQVRHAARATIVSALATAVLVATLAGCSSDDVGALPGQEKGHAGEVTQDLCTRLAAESVTRASVVTGVGERVVVIGDSWASGFGLDDPGQSWPRYLDGEVRVSGFGGTGYSHGLMARCGPISFSERVPDVVAQGADLVVLEGGINDSKSDLDEVEKGFRATLEELKGFDVIVLSAPKVKSRAAAIRPVNKMMRRVSKEYGVTYINVFDLDLPMLEDNTHLTPAGHEKFGEIVAHRIAESRSETVPAHS
ncbi:lysophospholipase L1-like esterase [Nocardioides luteus]|uniref:SGNH hydrolase-type esterase domain-containing protein n=1 Tax=Nocardioides luteus TaxID=1844 RepID=A0ABQ5T415_9ACTN|nr:SGNH/GDSL hydrolase family protein [Nocardioides luteus]MDR7313681.1 lysophospholipase L1-like esterase [Nocardioides luteus]GGR64054.1 hypothetical protein GCM10010197_34380 [Nocardioides luteus]GLJ70472.1 hypothetical protein GCM10017579_45080 [Nocardioides luteus]